MVVLFYIMQTPSYFRQLHHIHSSLPLANCWPVGSWTSSCDFKQSPDNVNQSTLEGNQSVPCFTGTDSIWTWHVNAWSMNMWDVWVSHAVLEHFKWVIILVVTSCYFIYLSGKPITKAAVRWIYKADFLQRCTCHKVSADIYYTHKFTPERLRAQWSFGLDAYIYGSFAFRM